MIIRFHQSLLLPVAVLLVGATACSTESPASTPLAGEQPALFAHETVELAWKTAAAHKRPLVVMFTSDHCPHCDRMLAETYGHPDIKRFLATHSETALAHAAGYRELTKRLGIRGYPTSIVVSAEGQIVDTIEGYLAPQEFARRVARWMGPGAVAASPTAPVSR